MEETVIVIMLKNPDTGFLETEIGCYKIYENQSLIYNVFAAEGEDGIKAHLKLTVDRPVEDWQYSAILDYYEPEALVMAQSVTEDDSGYDPMWDVVMDFDKDNAKMENALSALLSAHKKELDDVFKAIEEVKEDYFTE